MHKAQNTLVATVLLLFVGHFVNGQDKVGRTKTLKVGLYTNPPFVMEADDRHNGMAIELWEHIGENLNFKTSYEIFDSIKEIVEATETGKIDVAVTNLTITENRASKIDFTHPWYDAGLRIMIADNGKTSTSELIRGLKDAGHLGAYLWVLGVILFFTIGLTWFDRKFDEEFPSRWRDGIAESFYSVMLVVTSGSLKRKNLFGWIGRILSAFWLIIGIIVIAYITSSITSVMTTLSLSNEINGLNDLNDKEIGVLLGSVSEDFATDRGYSFMTYNNLDAAVLGLEKGEVSAIIEDAPVLEYYSFTQKNEPVKVVGKLFYPDKYGFALPRNNSLTRPITLEVLKAQESGYLEELRLKYFGQAH